MVTYWRHIFTCDVKLSLTSSFFECSAWTKLMDQIDLENDQISTTWTPKMELKSSKLLRRTSKKGPKKEPMSQQRRQRGGRRHIRRQRRSMRGPMKTPNGAADAAWRRTTSEHGSNMNSKRYPKRVQMRGPEEGENRALACTRAQVSP